MAIAVTTAVASRAAATRGRLLGVDVARAVAFGGMLLAHFASSRRATDPGWLQAIDNTSDGRAAPLFCMVLGVSAGLLLRARGGGWRADLTLVLRGVALGAVGFAIWPEVDRIFLILPHYALLLALAPLLRRIRTRWLLPTAGLAFLAPSAIAGMVADHRLHSFGQPSSYAELSDVGAVARQLLWTGGYPLVGWVGFVLIGLWLAAQPLGDRGFQQRMVVVGGLITALQPLFVAIEDRLGPPTPGEAEGLVAFFDSAAHSNRTAWYVLAAGTAVAILGLALWLAAIVPSLNPLVLLGQIALSAYLAHILIGAHVVWPWRDREVPALATQMLVAAAVFVGLTVFAVLWRSRFRYGPVEAVLRLVTLSRTRAR